MPPRRRTPAPPPPFRFGTGEAVCVDVEAVDVSLRFDAAAEQATAAASVTFLVDGPPGRPVLDLRQDVEQVRLDGRPLPADAWVATDPPGEPGPPDGAPGQVRVLDVSLEQGSRHCLELQYRLGRPAAGGAVAAGWVDGDAVRFDLWMSDLQPGRYLEQWVPAPLCHDRFALSLDVELLGTRRPHVALANADGDGDGRPGRRWQLRYPAWFTALSPMLVVAPADQVELRHDHLDGPAGGPRRVLCARHVEVDVDLGAAAADIGAWLAYGQHRYGRWAHSERFVAFVWAPGRGMEYDGATTAAAGALEHEVFHSWFGRGVKPAHASDGWIDEAWTSWATASRRVEQPRFAAEALGLDEAPVTLRPADPWSRRTPVESYGAGARLFAGLAWELGGADRLRSAMAAWYRAHAGGFVDTDGLERHLSRWGGVELSPWFDRYVRGRDRS